MPQFEKMIDFDLSVVANATRDDLDMDLLQEFARAKVGVSLDELPDLQQQLVNWNILREHDGKYAVTLTGMLFFGKQPGEFLPQANLWLKRFKGLDTTEWHPGKEIDTPIPQAIRDALEFINSYSVVESISGMLRVAQAEYPEPVVREAIVNAIAHRNYISRGERIRVFMFDDRIEVRSPGPLPNSVTIEKMRYGIHKTRNPHIVHYLRAYGYWEGDGLGIPRMISQCRSNGIREPRFEMVGDDLMVTIYSRRYDEFHPEFRGNNHVG